MSKLSYSNLEKEINKLRKGGHYLSIISLIEEALGQDDWSQEQKLKLQYNLAVFLYETAEYNSALKIINDQINSINLENNLIISIDFSILKANIFWRLGEPKEGLKALNFAETLIVKAETQPSINLEAPKASFFLAKASILQVMGKLDLCESLLTQALEIYEKINDLFGKAQVLNRFGRIFWKKAEFLRGIEFHQQALEIGEILEDHFLIAQSSMSLGIIYDDLGDFNRAIENNQKCLRIWEQIGNKYYYGATLNNIGELYLTRGDIDDAQNYLSKALDIFDEIGNTYIKSDILNNIALTHQFRGEYEKSNTAFKESIRCLQQIGNFDDASKPYYLFIKSLIEQDQLNKANHLYRTFQTLVSKSKNELVHQRFELVKALLLEESQRTINKVRAQEIYMKLESSPIFDYEVVTIAMIKQCEFLLDELFNTSNIEIINELENKFGKLFELGQNQKIDPLIIESLLFKSRLALLTINIDRAKDLLFEAEMLVREKNLKSLLNKVENLKSDMNNQITLLEKISDKPSSIQDRMKLLQFDKMFDEHFQQFVSTKVNNESPIMFIIVHESGIRLFHELFQQEKNTKVDSHLISGFLTAINSFGRETFKVKESVKKISIEDYNIVIKSWKSLLLSYVFKGSIKRANDRFQQIVLKLTEVMKDWQSEMKKDYITLDESKRSELSILLQKELG